jgi:OPA family glycerol-3-phosphate transporter-like MFS transporter
MNATRPTLSWLILGLLCLLPFTMVQAQTPAARPAARAVKAPAGKVAAADKAPAARKAAKKAVDARKAPAASVKAGKAAKTASKAAAAKKVKTSAGKKKKARKKKKGFFIKLLPILLLLIVVAFIMRRLPPPNFGGVDTSWRTKEFLTRRIMNWLPLGLTYAFLYMGRYNLKVSKFAFESMKDAGGNPMMSNKAFGIIFAVGTIVYGCSFLINGPLTDRLGGRLAILTGAAGSAVMNLLMGLAAWSLMTKGFMYKEIAGNFVVLFSILYGVNMYFQSFGAVAIVKVNSAWFHVRERGEFGAIFGILISLGIYFAFDISFMILSALDLKWVFLIPAVMLVIFWVLDTLFVRDTPGEAGQTDFDTADASSGDDGPQLGAVEVFKRMLTNPIIMTIALIEFCSGFIRQAPMQWYRTFAKQTDVMLHLKGDFIYDNWGMFLCIAGITGGVFAGIISDRVFQSRRGPVAAILYMGVTLGSIALFFAYKTPALNLFGIKLSAPGVLAILISMCVIGVHGMLSGTASMDFGGKKNVGIAVGIIDGFVYLGTAVMSITYAFLLPQEKLNAAGKIIGPATQPANWKWWPITMIIIGIMGFLFATRVWNATPQSVKAANKK